MPADAPERDPRDYSILITRDDEGDFIASIPELEGCICHGTTESQAIRRLREVQEVWMQSIRENGETVPPPVKYEDQLPSGKWVQRCPRSLHLRLSRLAEREGVSLNQIVTTLLSEGLTRWAANAEIVRRAEEKYAE